MASRVTEQIKIALGWDLGAFKSGIGEIKKGLEDNTKESKGWGDALKAGLAVGATVGAAIGGWMLSGVQGARELNAQIRNSKALWGDNATEVIAWGKAAVDVYGITQKDALRYVNVLGQMMQNQGVATDTALQMSQKYVEVGSALDSAFSMDRGYTVEAITSALQGNYQMLRNVGVMTNATEVSQRALEMSGKSQVSQLTAQDKALALHQIVLDQSENAVKAYGDGSESLGLQQARLTANLEQMRTEAGAKLLPVLLQLFKIVNDSIIPVFARVMDVVTSNTPLFSVLAGVVGFLAVAFKVVTVATALWNAVLAMNPIVLIVIALAALVAGLILAYQNIEGFRNIVNAAFSFVVSAAQWLWSSIQRVVEIFTSLPTPILVLMGPIGVLIAVIRALVQNWDTVRNAIGAVVGAISGAIGWIANMVGNLGNLVATAARVTGIAGFFQAGFGAISGIVGGVVGAIQSVINAIQNVINLAGRMKDAIGGALGGIGGILGLQAPLPPAGVMALMTPGGTPMVREGIGARASLPEQMQQLTSRLNQLQLGGRAGPALQIQQAVFREEADITVLLRKTEFMVEAGRL